MHWTRIQSLLGVAETQVMLDCGRHILTLKSLDVIVGDLSCKIWVLGIRFFNLHTDSLVNESCALFRRINILDRNVVL